MAKKKVIVCFDYENDNRYKNLINAWDKNLDIDFSFNDLTPNEIQTSDIPRIKGALTTKINQATYTLVIVGRYSNSQHKDHKEIGYKNWQNFEIAKSKENKNKLIAVKLDRLFDSPDELKYADATWVYSFDQKEIIDALNKA